MFSDRAHTQSSLIETFCDKHQLIDYQRLSTIDIIDKHRCKTTPIVCNFVLFCRYVLVLFMIDWGSLSDRVGHIGKSYKYNNSHILLDRLFSQHLFIEYISLRKKHKNSSVTKIVNDDFCSFYEHNNETSLDISWLSPLSFEQLIIKLNNNLIYRRCKTNTTN